jgi:hypothetical protein
MNYNGMANMWLIRRIVAIEPKTEILANYRTFLWSFDFGW